MLETGFHTFTRLNDDPLKVNGTVGRCVSQMGLRIIDDEAKDMPHGEVGEIAAVGPSVHFGYLNNPDANRDSFTADGWFRTGDLGQFVDQEGNVRMPGERRKSSTAAARSTSRAKSKSCCTSTRPSCRWRSSARPMRGSARRTVCVRC